MSLAEYRLPSLKDKFKRQAEEAEKPTAKKAKKVGIIKNKKQNEKSKKGK